MKTSLIGTVVAVLLISCHSLQAECPPILTTARGTISGEIQDGDVLLLKFIYSGKRVESSSPQHPQGQAFTVSGAYSTFAARNQNGDLCNSAPRLIQVVLRDKNGVALDTADLTTPDPSNGVIELNFGKKQAIVLHRPPMSSR